MTTHFLQYRVLQTTDNVPIQLSGAIDRENFEKAKAYNLDKFRFEFVSGLWNQLLGTAVIGFNVFPLLWSLSGRVVYELGLGSGEVTQTLAFVTITTLVTELIALPMTIYSQFVIEERHGFNKYTATFFAVDKVKKFFVGQAISLPIVAAMIKIIRAGGQYFFLSLWAFLSVATLALITIYPDFIAPLFDKYTALPEGELKQRIEQLAASIDFPLKKLFVVEGSKRSTHSNAFFFGFYKNKCIVLFDTLIEGYVAPDADEKTQKPVSDASEGESSKEAGKREAQPGCTNDEIIAVLAHEFGHWQCSHVLKNLIIAEANLFCSLAVFGLLFQNDTIYHAFGFANKKPVIVGLIIIFQYIFSPYNEVAGFLMTCLSRRFEFQGESSL